MSEVLDQAPPESRLAQTSRRSVSSFDAPATHCRASSAILFALTLLLSSSLLFLVQPMFAKMVLPRLGGTAAVWNTCMVFFQACLLGGYAYAHFVTRRLRITHQVMLHAAVLALPLLLLPIALPRDWAPPADANPVRSLLLLLSLTVGLPFLVVSTTAPLVQRWFALTGHRDAGDPYFLYAASNAGSMAALLGYPTIVEPLLRLGDQSRFWTVGYVLFAVCTLLCGLRVAFRKDSASSQALTIDDASTHPRIDWPQRLRWIVLAAVPSSYLLGVTTFITTDVAAVPLFWVVPLALYLLTFVLVFACRQIVPHRLMVYALPTAVLAPILFLLIRAALPVWASLTLHLFAFFVTTMVCHGELTRLRPPPRHLTEFYLMISIGGVLGGAFNALLAPLIFSRALEYPLDMALACLLCPPRPNMSKLRRQWSNWALPIAVGVLAWIGMAGVEMYGGGVRAKLVCATVPLLLCVRLAGRRVPFACAVAALLLVASFFQTDRANLLDVRRSFFGVHRVVRRADGKFNELFHGTTVHGRQLLDAGRPIEADQPLTYYHHEGPIGQIMQQIPAAQRRSVGVIGLGIGSIAAYAHPGDHYTYFEIDPVVRLLAEDSGYFTYLQSARQRGADVKVVLGDARLTLAAVPNHSLDLLVLDAFSGDAIPLHLLTREALATYRQKLSSSGRLAVHISNLYLDLAPVLANLSADAGWHALGNNDLDMSPEKWRAGKAASQWMLLARDEQLLEPWKGSAAWVPASANSSRSVWTDDYSNIIQALK